MSFSREAVVKIVYVLIYIIYLYFKYIIYIIYLYNILISAMIRNLLEKIDSTMTYLEVAFVFHS